MPAEINVLLDGISPSRFGATSWSFPATNYWVEVVDPSYRDGGWHAMELVQSSEGGVVIGCGWLLMCCCQNTRRRRLWQHMSNTYRWRSARVLDHASEP